MSKPANLIGASKQVKLGASSPSAGSLYEPGRRSGAWLKCAAVYEPAGTQALSMGRRINKSGYVKLPLASTQARAQIEFTEQTPDGQLRHASFTNCEIIKNRER